MEDFRKRPEDDQSPSAGRGVYKKHRKARKAFRTRRRRIHGARSKCHRQTVQPLRVVRSDSSAAALDHGRRETHGRRYPQCARVRSALMRPTIPARGYCVTRGSPPRDCLCDAPVGLRRSKRSPAIVTPTLRISVKSDCDCSPGRCTWAK